MDIRAILEAKKREIEAKLQAKNQLDTVSPSQLTSTSFGSLSDVVPTSFSVPDTHDSAVESQDQGKIKWCSTTWTPYDFVGWLIN